MESPFLLTSKNLNVNIFDLNKVKKNAPKELKTNSFIDPSKNKQEPISKKQ